MDSALNAPHRSRGNACKLKNTTILVPAGLLSSSCCCCCCCCSSGRGGGV